MLYISFPYSCSTILLAQPRQPQNRLPAEYVVRLNLPSLPRDRPVIFEWQMTNSPNPQSHQQFDCEQRQLRVFLQPTCIEMQSALSSTMTVCCRGRLSADRSFTYFPSMYLVPSRYTLWLIVPWGSIWVIHW